MYNIYVIFNIRKGISWMECPTQNYFTFAEEISTFTLLIFVNFLNSTFH